MSSSSSAMYSLRTCAGAQVTTRFHNHRRSTHSRFGGAPLQAEPGQNYQYRAGTDADGPEIQRIIISQMMNPLGLNAERFVVACTDSEPVVGFGQVVPHGSDSAELRSLYVKPEHRKYGVGSEIVRRLVESSSEVELYVITSTSTCRFYEKAGFKALAPWQVPSFMRLEIVVGAVIVFLVERSGILGMVYDPNGSGSNSASG